MSLPTPLRFGPEFLINTRTTNSQFEPTITALSPAFGETAPRRPTIPARDCFSGIHGA